MHLFTVRTLILLIASCSLAAASGCTDEPGDASVSPAEAEQDIPFRRDGHLQFYSSGGLDTVTIDVEIADTDSARRRGLMERDSLPMHSGMLFLFSREAPRSFTMANMDMGIDILFVGADRRVVSISRYARPGTPTIRSEAPARYVVETPAGFADEFGIVEGDSVSWTREPADTAES